MGDAFVTGYVRGAPLSLALVDPDEFRVREASSTFARFLGTTREELEGTSLPDALVEGEELRDALRLLAERGAPVSGLELRSKHGGRGFVVTAWRSEENDGSDLAVLAVEAGAGDELADRIRQVNEALLVRALDARDRAARAEAASRSKSIFLASISHELRTPLNSVVGYLDLMLQGVPDELPEGARQPAERARSAAWHLRDMIEQIITAARSETHDDEDLEEVDVAAVAREVRDMIEGRARDKGIELRVTAADDGARLLARPRELRQILVNLVSNAVKFTDEGHVAIEVDDGDPVRIHVSDTGRGIPEDVQDRIFEQFWQAPAADARTSDGLGIGLWVVGTLVERLGGEVSVRSQPDQGSTFEVRLPRKRTD